MPTEAKMALHISRSGDTMRGYTMRGYTEISGENNNPDTTQDLKETFDIGVEYPGVSGWFHGPNPWPDLLRFRQPVSEYLNAMNELASTLLGGIAVGVGLDKGFFADLMQQPILIQRMVHYPPQSGPIFEASIGNGAHTDYGLLTILTQGTVGGLQVRSRQGQWIEAPPRYGCLIVNIGVLMQYLTNDYLVATEHRVINASGQERYFLPCFVDCDSDAIITPHPSFISPGKGPNYKAVRCSDYKLSRYLAAIPSLGAGPDQ
jgi:isopenicillin N synthase-like dioxygenase